MAKTANMNNKIKMRWTKMEMRIMITTNKRMRKATMNQTVNLMTIECKDNNNPTNTIMRILTYSITYLIKIIIHPTNDPPYRLNYIFFHKSITNNKIYFIILYIGNELSRINFIIWIIFRSLSCRWLRLDIIV